MGKIIEYIHQTNSISRYVHKDVERGYYKTYFKALSEQKAQGIISNYSKSYYIKTNKVVCCIVDIYI